MTIPDNLVEIAARAAKPWAWVKDYAYDSRACVVGRASSLIQARAALSAVAPQIEREAIERCAKVADNQAAGDREALRKGTAEKVDAFLCVATAKEIAANIRALTPALIPQEGEGN